MDPQRQAAEPTARGQLHALSVRLPPTIAVELKERAWAARLSASALAVIYIQAGLAAGAGPAPAPPARLDGDLQRLLQLLPRLHGNLTQLLQHAADGPAPLPALAAEGGALSIMRTRVEELHSAARRGNIEVPLWMLKLQEPAGAINELAHRLNSEPTAVAPATWHAPLAALHAALVEGGQRAAQG